MEKLAVKDRKEAAEEALTNRLNGKIATIKTTGAGRAKKIYVMRAGAKEAEQGEAEEAKAAKPKEKKAKETPAPKIPHVGVDFEMPTLAQVAEFVRKEAEKGTKALTATELRKHFGVPSKIPFNQRLKQLEKANFGVFTKIEGLNTLTLDLEAIKAGRAAIEKKRKAKKGKALKPEA